MGDEPTPDVNAGEINVDLFADDADVTAPKESSPAEIKETPAVEEPVKPEAKVAEPETDPTPEPESDKPAEGEIAAEVPDTAEFPTAEKRKEDLNREIRELNATRNQLRNDVATENAKYYQAPTAEELIAQGTDPVEARFKALEQRTEVAEYTAHVSDLNANLNQQSLQVLADFPIFDPKSSDYNEAIAAQANTLYKQVSGAQTDENTGLVNNINVMPYQIYKTIADTFQASAESGAVAGQRSAEKMLAAADGPSSAPPKQAKVDPLMELWKKD